MSSRSSADRWASRLLLTCILWTLGDAAGDDVILPCQLDPAINAHNYIVEWSKPDLKPDPSTGLTSDHYVHLYLGGTEVLDMKIPAFIGRTQMFTEELKHGNLSVKILNITSADQGKYRCFVPNLMKHAAVQLVVDPDFKNRTTETPSYPGDLQTPDPRNKTDDKRYGVCCCPEHTVSRPGAFMLMGVLYTRLL
ncbi:hypothetical protein INR49_022715 [Caranx melampygus]|nr:hypothetical protein INR49_022715 [Caranx melampygus]